MDIINNMNKSSNHYAEGKKLDHKEKKNIPIEKAGREHEQIIKKQRKMNG